MTSCFTAAAAAAAAQCSRDGRTTAAVPAVAAAAVVHAAGRHRGALLLPHHVTGSADNPGHEATVCWRCVGWRAGPGRPGAVTGAVTMAHCSN